MPFCFGCVEGRRGDNPFSLSLTELMCRPKYRFTDFRLVLILLIFILVPVRVFAENTLSRFKDDKNVPWHIIADEISYDEKADVYVGKGNVRITKKEKKGRKD